MSQAEFFSDIDQFLLVGRQFNGFLRAFFSVLAVLRIEVISGSEGSTIVMEGRASRTDFPFLFSLDIVSYQEKKELQKNVLLMFKKTEEDIGTQASDCSDNTG